MHCWWAELKSFFFSDTAAAKTLLCATFVLLHWTKQTAHPITLPYCVILDIKTALCNQKRRDVYLLWHFTYAKGKAKWAYEQIKVV